MAHRPVFVAGDQKRPACRVNTEFEWFAGLSDAQKRRCIDSLHAAYTTRHPGARVLEISSKSRDPLGVQLSAFNLTRLVPSLGQSVPVENIFQGSKVFAGCGPFTELYSVPPIRAKRDPRLRTSGPVTGFAFEGRTYSNWPPTAFYCWLWCNALLEHPELAEALLQYDAFTDIVFNPEKSLNFQAEAAALFVTLAKRGQLDRIRDFAEFVKLL